MKTFLFPLLKLFAFLTLVSGEIDLDNPIAREIFSRSKASDIKSWMEPTEDPCNNFYKYACGKWERMNSATSNNIYTTDQFQEFRKGLQRKLKKLLATHEKSGDPIVDKVRDFYESCRYIKNNRNEYKQNLQTFYREYGEFSFMNKEEGDNTSPVATTNWWSLVANIHRTYGKSSILSLTFRPDVKNNSHNMLYLKSPEFVMGEPDMMRKTLTFLHKYFDISEEKTKLVAKNLLEFEWFIMQGATDESAGKTVNDLLTLYNTTDLIEKYKDFMDMEMFLKTALNSSKLPEKLYVFDELYLEKLGEAMQKSNPQTVQDYILWLLLDEYTIESKDVDWDELCSEKTKKYFGKFIDHYLYNQYRSEEFEKLIFQLWQEIKSTFRENLESNKYKWLSADVRQHAVAKLKNMKLSINSYDEEDFEKFFKDLLIDPKNYVKNIQNTLKRTEILKHTKSSHKPEGIEDAEVLSFTPVYITHENEIIIPIALMQPSRLFHPLYPNAVTYSGIGFLLAHEMIHGFDDGGRLFDANGHTNNWWDEQSVKEFNLRRQCFQNQYHSYIYDGSPLPSSVSQAENIADNAGVKLAYQAYVRWLNKTDTKTRETFPNLSYNNKEIFFLTMAQLWCEDVHESYRTLFVNRDLHAPGMYRIIGTLSNFKDFSEIFQCKPGSVMNPLEKCEIY